MCLGTHVQYLSQTPHNRRLEYLRMVAIEETYWATLKKKDNNSRQINWPAFSIYSASIFLICGTNYNCLQIKNFTGMDKTWCIKMRKLRIDNLTAWSILGSRVVVVTCQSPRDPSITCLGTQNFMTSYYDSRIIWVSFSIASAFTTNNWRFISFHYSWLFSRQLSTAVRQILMQPETNNVSVQSHSGELSYFRILRSSLTWNLLINLLRPRF